MSATAINEKTIVQPEIVKSEIVLTHQELEQEKQKYLKRIQKSVSIPGFRPGKVPASIIHKKYGSVAFYEGFENLLKEKTYETFMHQASEVLYYVYNFQNTGTIQEDGTDKKIEIEYLLEPQVTIDFKDKEVELIKLGFTEGQRKIYSDILILFNFLKNNPVEKLDNFNQMFLIRSEIKSEALLNSDDETKKKKAQMVLVIHTYQFQSYGLNELLPSPIERDKTYSVDAKKWLSILENNFPDKKIELFDFLETVSECSDTTLNIHFKDIQAYDNLNDYINTDRITQVFESEEAAEVSIDWLYQKLAEVIDVVADYFSGSENLKRSNTFIRNLIQVDIPDDFINKLYNNYVKDEDKQYSSIDSFKNEIVEELENKLLRNILPNTFDINAYYDKLATDEFITNVAKTYWIERLLSHVHLFSFNFTKEYVLFTLQNTDEKGRKELLQNYYTRDAIFSFAKKFSQDVKTSFKLDNINQVNFYEFLDLKKELFV